MHSLKPAKPRCAARETALAIGLCVTVWMVAGCGRLQFESVDAASFDASDMDAGDAEVHDARIDAANPDGTTPDAMTEDGGGGPVEIHVIPNETLLDTGALHTCAGLFGRIYCWGDNAFGQLGDGTTQDRSAPVQLGTISNVVDLQLGESHSCAMTRIGAVYCWGHNEHGQLGDGTTQDRHRPTLVAGLEQGAQALWVGPFHACARADDGLIRCWGLNDHGQLGNGATAVTRVPVPTTELTDATVLALGADMTCGLASDGTVSCLGANAVGQLGRGTTSTADERSAAQVLGVVTATRIAAGHRHVCVGRRDGTAQCWGDNARFQCGNDSDNPREPNPVAVAMLIAGRDVAASESTTCAVDETGLAKCWGARVAGSGTDRRVLTTISGLSGVREVHAGRAHQCMRVTSNYIHCVGDNSEGQIGDGTRLAAVTPFQVLGLPAPVSGPTPRCGDRFITGDDLCDDGEETARCNTNCTLSECGDGVLNASAGETCETGGDLDAGGCNPDCTLP